jgi:phage tail-like protein
MPPARRDAPYSAFNFQVIVQGIADDGTSVKAAFKEVAGLEVAQAPIEYRTGNMDIAVTKLPGLKSFTNITCTRGATGDVEFWNWLKAGLDGQAQRKEGSIVLQDENQQEVMRWNFSGGWPCKYTGPSFDASKNEVAMEKLEICVDALELDAA